MTSKYSVTIALIYTRDPKWLCIWTSLVYHYCVLLHLTYWSVPFLIWSCWNHLFFLFWILFCAWNAAPSDSSVPAYSRHSSLGAHVTLIVTPFICTRSGAAKQVDKWALLRAGAHTEGCWLFHGNGGGGGVISSFLWAAGCFAWIQEFRTTSTQWEG